MDARGNGKGSGNHRMEDDECDRMPAHIGQSSGRNPSDRHFNPARNGQLRYNPGHNIGRAYGGMRRGGSGSSILATILQAPVQNTHRNNQPQPQRTAEQGGDQT
jgi:hypothetical protein